MSTLFVIEDEAHDEQHSKHSTLEEAIVELKRLALIPWDAKPNVAPCTNWRNCGRRYEIVEYETSRNPWKVVRRFLALEISASGVIWSEDLL